MKFLLVAHITILLLATSQALTNQDNGRNDQAPMTSQPSTHDAVAHISENQTPSNQQDSPARHPDATEASTNVEWVSHTVSDDKKESWEPKNVSSSTRIALDNPVELNVTAIKQTLPPGFSTSTPVISSTEAFTSPNRINPIRKDVYTTSPQSYTEATSEDDIIPAVSTDKVDDSSTRIQSTKENSSLLVPTIDSVVDTTNATIVPVNTIKITTISTSKPTTIITSTSASSATTPVIHAKTTTQQSVNNNVTTITRHSTSVHPLLIYSIRYEIRSYDLFQGPTARSFSSALNGGTNSALYEHFGAAKHSASRTLIGGLKNTVGLDFYYSPSESFIFWTDVVEERIYKGTIVNGSITNVDTVIQSGLATAEGLAVDWVAKNLYWIESTLDHIEVANMSGSARRTLIAGDMESPRAIALDPRYGLMFWSDWDRKSPRIERASMAGEDRRTLVRIDEVKGGWPNGITLDYDTMEIYWIDASSDTIHAVDYEGKNYRLLHKGGKWLGHPFSITLFESNLYWTDWKTNTVSTANKYGKSEIREIQRQTGRPLDIKVFHPNRQPAVDPSLNPCAINNGNCSHLCLLTLMHRRKCECPHLMRINADNQTCETDERVLLIGKTNEIRAVDILEPLHHVMAPISVPRVFNPRQFEFDAKTRNIFWADSQTNEVKRAQLAGNLIETIIDVIIETPSGLALDWISGNIYVTSSGQNKNPGKIFISNLNGEFISVLMDGLISPKSIAINPLQGLLFYIDEDENSRPIIYKTRMDGTDRVIIADTLSIAELNNPSNLAMDIEANRVYWINQALGPNDNTSIQYYDVALGRVVTVLDESGLSLAQKINPTSLCVDGDYLIMNNRQPNEAIVRAKKNNISDRIIYKTQSLEQISALRVYNASVQVGSNACSKNNGGCSQLCIPISNVTRTCKCTMGYAKSLTNETDCIGRDEFLIFSYNLGMKGISLKANSSPDDYYLPPIHRAFRASSIDFVHQEHLIYWVDNEEGSITRIKQDTTNYQVIVQGLESEECIAVDWVVGNIYWLDPYYDIIEVARLDGSNRYVIISGDMEKPNGIVVDPIRGYIAWSDVGSNPKIETALLDGSNRRAIVSSRLSHVDDLAIDHADNYIYWVDSTQSLVERIRPDGSERLEVYKSPTSVQLPQTTHLVSIALHREYIYLADSVYAQGSILRVNKNKPIESIYIQQQLGDGIRDIAIFTKQPMVEPEINPCALNNGGCQDLCLFLGEPGKKRCICSHAKLNSDGLTCKPYDTFILFSKSSQIDSLHIQDDERYNNSPYPSITIESRSNIISLTVDYDARRVIYSDITRDQICSVQFNGTDRRVLVEKQSFVEGIAFANNQLYWTSIQDNSISRFNTTSTGKPMKICDNGSGNSCQLAGIEKLVKLDKDDRPRGIAIDSCTNYVYWTNWNEKASIQRASPSNNHKVESIITSNIKVPNGIAIDQRRRKLYWCDAKLDKIETCDMDGTNRVVLISNAPQHPFALAVWKNNIFWTDWIARSVYRADKYTGQQVVQVRKVVQRPMGIAVASGDSLDCPADSCAINNGGCPPGYICITHDTESGQPYTECRGPDELTHDLALPASRCKHLGGSRVCNHANYHDIIADNLDRYTELVPVDTNYPTPAQSPILPSFGSSPAPTQQFETSAPSTVQPVYSPPSQRTPPPIPMKMKPINPSTSSTSISTARATSSTSSTTSSSFSTIPTSTLSTPTDIHTNATQPTTIQPRSSSLPPCQIAPAALQPTTTTSTTTHLSNDESECRARGLFRCYLSSDRLICINNEMRCDGNFDCPSKEDENDCYLSSKGQYNGSKQDTIWHRYVTVILVILAAAIAALFLVSGTRGRRRWFVNNGSYSQHEMFDDNGTNIEISNPMFDDDDSAHLVNCAFSIDLNERTTNFSNPLYERQVLLVNDKNTSTNPST